MENILRKILLTLVLIATTLPFSTVKAQEDLQYKGPDYKIATYIGGIGCSHCAVVSPFLHEKVQEGGFILVEYEMYQKLTNSTILNNFADEYGITLAVPQLFFSPELNNAGDTPIIDNWETMYSQAEMSTLYLPDGTSTYFDFFSLNDIKRYPRIYSKDRVAIRESVTSLTGPQQTMIRDFIIMPDINTVTESLSGEKVEPKTVQTPGGNIKYEHAVTVNGWRLQWNGEEANDSEDTTVINTQDSDNSEITWGKTIMLALADCVNPCALSVLTLMLFAIITYNPGDRKQILLSGLAFVLAVIIMYLFYGFLIIKAFQFIQSIATFKLYLYKGLGIAAMLLGILELKDFFFYKPGSVGTEMPLFLRPKVNKLISKITSPVGAFGIGLFVTLFLLPCTIGPYVILGGMVAQGGFLASLPHLLLYNVIFVLPMTAVTIAVYLGSSKIDDIGKWREKNIRKMHLISGALIFIMGLLMLLGIF